MKEFCGAEIIKNSIWCDQCWQALVHRRALCLPWVALYDRDLGVGDEDYVPQLLALEDGPEREARARARSSAGAHPGVSDDDDESEFDVDDFELHKTAENLAAWEECNLRDTLNDISSLRVIDSKNPFHSEEQKVLAAKVEKYLVEWDDDHRNVYLNGAQHFCQSLRVWVTETLWCLDAQAERRETPYSLWRPHDRHVRLPANENKDAQDPGNMTYEVLVNVLRLWDFVNFFGASESMQRVSTSPYGSNANNSARGPCGLPREHH